MQARVQQFFDTRTYTLTFVVWDAQTQDAVIIDPVLDYDPVGSHTWTESIDQVLGFVRQQGLRVHYVLETHAHADHLSGSQLLRRELGAKVVIGERITEVQQTFKQIFDMPETFHTDGSQFDRLVKDDETLHAGSLAIEVLATPGHTPACVTYKIGDAIFTAPAAATSRKAAPRPCTRRCSASTGCQTRRACSWAMTTCPTIARCVGRRASARPSVETRS
jgi:glyoxylase-like metal-dependent hydrolase (beta-lactamase superfamily II)